MKISSISVGNKGPEDDRTMEQFVDSGLVATHLGKLLIALVAETAWSSEYTIDAFFYGDYPGLRITHPTFLAYQQLTILGEDQIYTVRDVEDAVRKHFHDSGESLDPEIDRLQGLQNNMSHASDMILVNKAKAAIVAVFPQATDAYRNHAIDCPGEIYAFVLLGGGSQHEQVFMAREIDGEFVHGIASMPMTASALYNMNSPGRRQRFWETLALAFAAKELGIPEQCLYCQEIDVVEKEFLWPRPAGYDPYIVREVLLRQPSIDGQIVVTFGADNLPASAVLREEISEV